MEMRDSSELRLLEVSRGVRKLTQMLGSWSKAPNLVSRSKYEVTDLLRGSSALQESLTTIRRLQETLRMMSLMEQILEGKEDVDGQAECASSSRFGALYGDMKGVVKVKLNKKNLAAIVACEGIAVGRNMSSKENLQGMAGLATGARAPNLVARLMGLKKLPSEATRPVKREDADNKQAPGNENTRMQSWFANSAGRPPENGGGATPHFSCNNNWEMQRKKESNLKDKLSDDGDRHMQRAVKRMDRAPVEYSPKLTPSPSLSHDQQRKKSNYMNHKFIEKRKNNQYNSSPLSQPKRTEPPEAKPGNVFAAAKFGAKAVDGIRSYASRKKKKKKGQSVSNLSKNIKQTASNTKCNGVVRRTKSADMDSDVCSDSSSSTAHILPQRLSENPNHFLRENMRMGAKSFCEVMTKMSNGGKKRTVQVKASMQNCLTEAGGLQKDVKLLLLSCSEFLTEARRVFGFDIHPYQMKTRQWQNFDEGLNAYELGCAKELMVRKSHQLQLLSHPMSGGVRSYCPSSKASICLEQLVEGISHGLKELNGFYREDEVCCKLERDLRCKDLLLSASWDFGWSGWVCVEEADAVVDQVEKNIIFRLVGEIVVDLVH